LNIPEKAAYYYLDDISVIEINSANAYLKDSLINPCFMDSVQLGTDSTEFATYTWSSTTAGVAALSCTNCPNPKAKPTVTTKYYLTKQQCSATTIDSVTVVILTPTTQANASIKDTLTTRCLSDSVILGTDNVLSATYTWSSTAAGLAALGCTNCANPIAKPTITTKYYLKKTECSAIAIDSVVVVVLTPTTQANAGNDKTICIGDFVQLGTNDSLAFTNYSWQNSASLSCSNCAMPFANPNVTTTYTVQRTECSTVTTDTVKIIIDDCDPSYSIPNVFTPNYDDVNDTWGINFSTVNDHIKNFKMSIYDRWGLEVYSSNSELSTPNSKWDGHTTSGEECSNGVYYYIITFEKNEKHILLKGHLSLFR
jgi:gliding motility-associated-like protein